MTSLRRTSRDRKIPATKTYWPCPLHRRTPRTAAWKRWRAQQVKIATDEFIRKNYPNAAPGDSVFISLPIFLVMTGIDPKKVPLPVEEPDVIKWRKRREEENRLAWAIILGRRS